MDFDDMFDPKDGESLEDAIKRLMTTIDDLSPDDAQRLTDYLQRVLGNTPPIMDVDEIFNSTDSNIEVRYITPDEAREFINEFNGPETLESLQSDLEQLVKDEEYEEAAKLRDKIDEIIKKRD